MDGKGGWNNDFPDRMGGSDKNVFPGGMNNGMDAELMGKVMEVMRPANGVITDDIKETLVSLGLTAEQIDRISPMAGERFAGMGQNRGNRTPSANTGCMEPWGQNRNAPNHSDANAPPVKK